MKTVTEQYSVSHGTMREEDLVPAFVSELESLGHPKSAELSNEADQIAEKFGFDSSEMSEFLNETLFDALNECAGDGLYFGSHPGDGSDYGFWMSESPEDEDTDEDEEPVRCDQCEALMINGTFCHETGCPNSRKTYVQAEERWVRFVECRECGEEYASDDTHECYHEDEERGPITFGDIK